QAVLVIPGRHPELHVWRVAFQPLVPLPVIEQAGLAVQKIQQTITGNAHERTSLSVAITLCCSTLMAFCRVAAQWACWRTNKPSSSVFAPLSCGLMPISRAFSSAPSIHCVAPRLRSFHRFVVP